MKMLRDVNGHLQNNKFLAGGDISVADVVLASQLRYTFTLVID